MANPLLSVARGILLRGHGETGRRLDRQVLFKASGGIPLSTFRSAGGEIGARRNMPGLRFFDVTVPGRIAFGPGAGLAVGVSVGARNVRAVLVDANGWEYYGHESETLPNQLAAEPDVVLGQIRTVVGAVLKDALQDTGLLVDGALPMLGSAVAWPTPIDRLRRPVGYALEHPTWHSGQGLDQRVQRELGIRGMPTYALNDAHAAAIAIAHRETHQPDYLNWSYPRLTVVLRLADNIGGAIVIIEPKHANAEGGESSGFLTSILIGGTNNYGGEIGHTPVSPTTVAALNDDRSNLDALAPCRCSCVPPGHAEIRRHLQAYASVCALTQRLYPDRPTSEALKLILANPNEPKHAHALADVGTLVGDMLLGLVAILDPATIAITGPLSLPPVQREIERRLDATRSFGSSPTVTTIDGTENEFISAKGAALTMIRQKVHRRLEDLLVDDREGIFENVQTLTMRVRSNPL